MKYTASFSLILILITGCSNRPEPVEFDLVSANKEILLFEQSLPIEKKVLEKAYKKVKPMIGLSNISAFEGKSFKGEFVFEAVQLPFIEYRFDKPYIIKKIHLKSSGFVVDGDASSSHIKKFEIVFFDAEKSPLYLTELDEDAQSIDGFHNVQATGFVIKTHSVYTPKDKEVDKNDIIAAFDARLDVEVIDGNYIYDIIAPVLTERASSISNEELLENNCLVVWRTV